MKGRSEADDSAAVNKERRKAVATGSKARRYRARRAPQAPRAPKATTNRKPARDKGVGAPAQKSSGVKSRGRNKDGRLTGKDSGGGGAGDPEPSDRSAAKLKLPPVEEPAMNGGRHGSEGAVDGGNATGSGIDVSPSPSAGKPCVNDRAAAGSGLEHEKPKHEEQPTVAPDEADEYMTQSPLAFELSHDGMGGTDVLRNQDKDSSGSSSKDGVSGGSRDSGSSRGSVDGTEGSGGGEDRSGITSGEGAGGDELSPAPAPDASPVEPMPVDDAAVDALATLLRELGVGDEFILKPEGRGDLQALLEEATGNQMRAVEIFFDRAHMTTAQEKVRCVHVHNRQRGSVV